MFVCFESLFKSIKSAPFVNSTTMTHESTKLMFQRSASMQVVKHGLEICHFILLLFSSDQIVFNSLKSVIILTEYRFVVYSVYNKVGFLVPNAYQLQEKIFP